MSGGFGGAGLFKSSLKCSAHLFLLLHYPFDGLSMFVLNRLLWLAELSRQSLGDVIHLFHIAAL